MSMPTDKLLALFGGITLLVLIGCVTALAWHGKIDGQAAIGFFTGLSLAGIIGTAQHVGVQSGANAGVRAAERELKK